MYETCTKVYQTCTKVYQACTRVYQARTEVYQACTKVYQDFHQWPPLCHAGTRVLLGGGDASQATLGKVHSGEAVGCPLHLISSYAKPAPTEHFLAD